MKFDCKRLDKPFYDFDNNTAYSPYSGLKENGPWDANSGIRDFDEIEVVYVNMTDLPRDRVNRYHSHLFEGAKDSHNSDFKGIKELFNINQVHFSIKEDYEYVEEGEFPIIIFSNVEHRNSAKRYLMENNIFSQAISEKEILFGQADYYWSKMENIALGIYAKNGGKPWKFDRENRKNIAGFDIRRNKQRDEVKFSLQIVQDDGVWEKSVTRVVDYTDLRQEFREVLESENIDILHINGHLNDKDLEEVLNDLDMPYIEVMKRQYFRLYNLSDNTRTPKVGMCVKITDDLYTLSTTGKPYSHQGTPKCLKIRINQAGDYRHKELLTDINFLSKATYNSTREMTKHPITTDYAKKASDNLQQGILPGKQHQKAPWFL